MTGGQSLASKLIVACLLLLAATNNVIAETEMADETSIENEYAICDGMNSCTDCLGAIVCDYYQGGGCSHYELQIADIRRYTVDRSTTIESVCERAALDEADEELCSSQTDCESCTSTVLSDGVTTCTFHPEFGWCSPDFCTMIGCGERTCPVPIPVVEEKPEETTTIETTDTSAENASSVASGRTMELIVVIALLSVAFL